MNAPGGQRPTREQWPTREERLIDIRRSHERFQTRTGWLVPIASGRGHHAAISIRQQGAVLWAGRLNAAESVPLPDARFVHVYIARGGADLEGAGILAAGDAVRLTAAGTPRLTAGAPDGADVLVWEMHAG